MLDATALGLDDDLRAAYRSLLDKIDAGMAPRDAVADVLATFQGQYAATLAEGFSAILSQSIGSPSVLAMQVGAVSLSARLYAQSVQVSAIVQRIVENHARGFNDARQLTLAIYEGYGFNQSEPLQISRRNPSLPNYMRESLLTDPGVERDLARHFARVRASDLKTPGLRAAYLQALDAIEHGSGAKLLENRLEVAFHERMRQFANRIAQTELHRAYAERQAVELMGDSDVEYVQVRMSATHPAVDICDYFAKVDRYGLGPGVYPKGKAPVPAYHPHCRCILAPKLDIRKGTKAALREGSERAWLREQGIENGARIVGSREKLKAVFDGADPMAIHDAGKDPLYRFKRVAEVDGRNWPKAEMGSYPAPAVRKIWR